MHTWTLPALLLMMTACAGGGELSKPNPPPVWPMEGVSPDDLPTGENVPSPTAPPAMPDTDAPPAADTDTPGRLSGCRGHPARSRDRLELEPRRGARAAPRRPGSTVTSRSPP